MQKAAFIGFCPYEIGNEVYVVYYPGEDTVIRTIENIRTIHYLKEGMTEFEFLFKENSTIDWCKYNVLRGRVGK